MKSISNSQVDRLGERLRQGQLDESDLRELSVWRDTFQLSYERVSRVLRGPLNLSVSGRPAKSTTSIIQKLQRESCRLSQMQDVSGCRVVVPDVPAQNRFLGAVLVFLPNCEVDDRRETPSHGYRAVHVIARVDGKSVEIQLRTEMQHRWAEVSERLSDILGPELKYGGGASKAREFLDAFGGLIETFERFELAQYERSHAGRNQKELERLFGRASTSAAYQRMRPKVIKLVQQMNFEQVLREVRG